MVTDMTPTGQQQGPPGWVLDVMQSIREEMTGQHTRMGERLEEGFRTINEKFDTAARESAVRDLRTEARLTTLETESRMKASALSGAAGWIALALTALGFLSELLGWRRHA